MAADVRVWLRRPANRSAGTSIPREMVIVRNGARLAVLRDHEPLGSTLIRLSRLSEQELRWAAVALDASLIREHPFVRDILLAFIEDRVAAREGACRDTGLSTASAELDEDERRGREEDRYHVPRGPVTRACSPAAATTLLLGSATPGDRPIKSAAPPSTS